jgi:hypothetical protein
MNTVSLQIKETVTGHPTADPKAQSRFEDKYATSASPDATIKAGDTLGHLRHGVEEKKPENLDASLKELEQVGPGQSETDDKVLNYLENVKTSSSGATPEIRERAKDIEKVVMTRNTSVGDPEEEGRVGSVDFQHLPPSLSGTEGDPELKGPAVGEHVTEEDELSRKGIDTSTGRKEDGRGGILGRVAEKLGLRGHGHGHGESGAATSHERTTVKQPPGTALVGEKEL